ncbi:MAG: pyrimidine dimer DNA glycosylase/endonuclease V [Nitrospirota bacterium]|nr:pyrimidine dimer DNA glycosylase/endonuclease V [Nitrospirota bacterium]
MRLWSLHPKYLDRTGLVALWREGLLAQKVLQGRTKGYRHHPQLIRFRKYDNPVDAISLYLRHVWEEAERRGYRFDRGKICGGETDACIPVTDGQLRLEWEHLGKKLGQRDPAQYEKLLTISAPEPHPLFEVVSGGVEEWERVP